MSSSELSLVAYKPAGKCRPSSSSSSFSPPASFLNSMFMSTVNSAAKTLVSMAATSKDGGGAIVAGGAGKWRPGDHLRFMVMMLTWMSLWVLRVLVDHIPSCSSIAKLGSYYCYSAPFSLLRAVSPLGLIEFDPRESGSGSASVSISSLQMILNEGVEDVPVQALGRALSHILALLNEIPATSRKYQFAMGMAERIMDGNNRSRHPEMMEVNRIALSSAFERTSALLHRSLVSRRRMHGGGPVGSLGGSAWAARAVRALPLGSYMAPYVKGLGACMGLMRSLIGTCHYAAAAALRGRSPALAIEGGRIAWEDDEGGEILAEKLGEELLWIGQKLRAYGALDEALMQWSHASGLASVSLTTDPRLQGLLVKISAMLFSELNSEELEVPAKVKFRVLLLWVPLFCHAGNGFAYPVLTYFEKADVERAIDEAISSLSPMDQEVILTNWMQEYAVSASDWPNLQIPYDRWCNSTRNFLA